MQRWIRDYVEDWEALARLATRRPPARRPTVSVDDLSRCTGCAQRVSDILEKGDSAHWHKCQRQGIAIGLVFIAIAMLIALTKP